MAARKIIEPGTKFTSKLGTEVEVILYKTATDVLVRRITDGVEFKCTSANLRKGLVSGIKGGHVVAKVVLELPDDSAWIAGMEGSYAVTRCGKVLSFKSGLKITELKGGVLSGQGLTKDKKTYKVMCLTLGGINKTYYVHRLVAETFIPNPDNLPVVNHIDGVKTNNSVENLEWCTDSDNVIHAYENFLMGNTRSRKLERGAYDKLIRQALDSGVLKSDLRVILEDLTDYEIEGRGFNVAAVRSIKCKQKLTEYPSVKIIEMHSSGMSMTEIAKVTGYSLSAISRKINGSRN
ncbi:HNH homing endonuclease [Pseudomonas phage 16Q]|nr:HNH homing endonuclease [Pseudomonas phage 16Q]